jgi:hypothetical protein
MAIYERPVRDLESPLSIQPIMDCPFCCIYLLFAELYALFTKVDISHDPRLSLKLYFLVSAPNNSNVRLCMPHKLLLWKLTDVCRDLTNQ